MRRAVGVSAILVVLALLGGGLAAGLTSALGISSEPSRAPTEHLGVAPARQAVLPPRFTRVYLLTDARVQLALKDLRAATSGPTEGTATLTVSRGTGPPSDDSYRLTGTATDLSIRGASPAGAARGLYDLAAAAREGRPLTANLGKTVRSRLPFRMVDLGAAGVTPDPDVWRAGTDYSHASNAFADVLLPTAPYIDKTKLAAVRADVDRYAEHVLAEGYNAVAVPGLLEYLTFPGTDVYRSNKSYVARARAMRAAFGPIWQHLHDLGLKVYFRTDMLALTTPLERYLKLRFGGLKTGRTDFWSFYAKGLDELYDAMPYVDGVLVRIGEAGSIYDRPGFDYYSKLDVTTVGSVRAMLKAFTAEADRADRDVIFRTWSVGVGAVGDMHTNPASYHAVLDGIDSPHLVVSTKYSLGDFYSHLPLNRTLEIGRQRRIVEFQSRREFEDSGGIPNDLGSLYQQAIRRFVAANPHVEGVWTWTQDGGPWRAGPMSLELKSGLWQLYELNTMLAARLARDPDADPAEITADWIRRYLTDDQQAVRAIGELMALSRSAVTHGLYIGPYANRRVRALGLEPPPMMWIFEWDILTGDSAALDSIYAITRDHGGVEAAIAEGDRAVATARRMRSLLASVPDSAWKDAATGRRLRASVDFEVGLLGVLAAYRAAVLRHVQWVDTGHGQAQWHRAEATFYQRATALERTFGGSLDNPTYNLRAADLGLDRAGRDPAMAWWARALLVLVVAWLGFGALTRRVSGLPGVARATWLAGTRPWRASEAVAELDRSGRILLVAVPLAALLLSRGVLTWFLAPAHWVITGLAWALFLAVSVRRRHAWPVVAAVGGAVLLRVVVLLVALVPHGPGGYWLAFWTEPTQRSVYVVVSFVAFAWVLVAAAWAQRAPGRTLAGLGAALLGCGLLVGAIGLERALTVWNDQMALLPWGMSRILGITVYLGIPTALPWWVAFVGVVLLVAAAPVGVVRFISARIRPRAGAN